MERFTYLHHNNCFFKCEKNMFKYCIKDVFTDLFTLESLDVNRLHIFELHNSITKCIVCLQLILTVNMKNVDSSFLICDECCNSCIDQYIFIEFYASTIFQQINSHWFRYDIRAHKYMNAATIRYNIGEATFINNSYKLIHRYYHTVPIIFLLSTLDINSCNNGLNLDIIVYILKFIY